MFVYIEIFISKSRIHVSSKLPPPLPLFTIQIWSKIRETFSQVTLLYLYCTRMNTILCLIEWVFQKLYIYILYTMYFYISEYQMVAAICPVRRWSNLFWKDGKGGNNTLKWSTLWASRWKRVWKWISLRKGIWHRLKLTKVKTARYLLTVSFDWSTIRHWKHDN